MRGVRVRTFVAGLVAAALAASLIGGISWGDLIDIARESVQSKSAQALSQFTPTGGALVTGTNTTITSAATTGNVGSWRGTLASDNFRWIVTATTGGFDQQVFIDGAELNNANKFIVVFEAAASNTTLQRVYQICDWTSSTEVDHAAAGNCTGGGWRTLNIRKAAITSATETAYTWHLYDGYWNVAAAPHTPLSTPLSNFIRNSDGRILLRAFAPTNCATCTHTIDYVRVDAVIDSVYGPSGFATSTASTVTNNYRNAENALFTGQSGSDNQYLQVAGTAAITADFYLRFRDVRTFPGANTIVVRAEYSCTTTGLSHRPKIWNFNSSAWEDLTATSIACSATDATSAFAKDSVTIGNYISGGEIRIGWRGLSNSTVGIRIDQMYVMVGAVNSDTALCEISYGTGTAANCANTRTLDTTLGSHSTWQQTTEADSATFGHDYYAGDTDMDATANEHAASANLTISASNASTTRITGLLYSMHWRSNATTITTQGQFKDLSGANATVSGGWTAFGTTNAATSYTYEDSVTNGYFTANPDDYVDADEQRINVRVRTSATTAASGVTRDIDFVFAAVQWVETTPTRYTLNYRHVPDGGTLVTGTNTTITSAATAGNLGSAKATLASDNFRWIVTATTGGFEQQVYMDNVEENGANKFIVVFEAAASNTTLQRVYQICDWSSSVEVDHAAAGNCTGGGWRTLNIRKAAITSATETSYTWHVYDGYWSTAANGNVPLSTPLSNFIRTSDGRVLLRAFAPTNCATCTHTIDYVRVDVVADSVYGPSRLTTSTASTVTNTYRNAENAVFTGQSASDNQYVQVAGTASITSDFYFTFQNVKTYPSMNAIVVRAEYSCTATGISHRPKIWNFTSSAWEDLTATSIACNATDAVGAFAKDSVDVNDYISNGEVRVGWRGLANGTQGIRIDMIYVMLGSVNSDSSECEISYGTGTAANCANTRTLDTTLGSHSTWQQTTEADSATFGHDYYAQDNDADATANEHAASANLWINASVGNDGQVVGRSYALHWRSNATTITTQGQFKDLSGANATISGGWNIFGTTNALTTYTYSDAAINGYFSNNAEDNVDTYNGRVNVRVRTTASTAASAVTRDIDFVFVSLQWVEPPAAAGGGTITLTLDSAAIALGNLVPGIPLLGTSTASVLVAGLSNGYALLVNRTGITSTMVHTDGATLMPEFTAWNSSGSGNATSTPGDTFSFRVASSTGNFNSTWWGSGTPLYAGIPASMDTIMDCASCNSGTTTSTINWRAAVPGTQKTGTYSGTSTFTALTNP